MISKSERVGINMDNQERYDELDNIVRSIDEILSDIRDRYYIDMLNEIKFEAKNQLEEVQEKLQEELEIEEREMNRQFEKNRL